MLKLKKKKFHQILAQNFFFNFRNLSDFDKINNFKRDEIFLIKKTNLRNRLFISFIYF